MFKEIDEKEREIREQLKKWNKRGIHNAGLQSKSISNLFNELAELERLSAIKLEESEER